MLICAISWQSIEVALSGGWPSKPHAACPRTSFLDTWKIYSIEHCLEVDCHVKGCLLAQISLDVRGKRNLQESLDFYVQGELMEGDNQYLCEDLGMKVGSLWSSLQFSFSYRPHQALAKSHSLIERASIRLTSDVHVQSSSKEGIIKPAVDR